MNKPNLSSGLLGAISFLALLGCTEASLAARLVDVSVVNRSTGERLTPYRHDGKLYVAGTPGERYSVELKSNRGERVLTVLSVDGINALTGQTAATLQSGYVLDGRQSYEITGWRKSMDDVAQFVFTALPNSYAARTGRPGNVGVIGVAVYREKLVPPPVQSLSVAPYSPSPIQPWRDESARQADSSTIRQSSPTPASAAKAESADNMGAAAGTLAESRAKAPAESDKKSRQLGTGHGEREYSPTRYTEFVRNSDSPDEVVTIYYDSRANLIARGIIASPRLAEPTPFPTGAGFVPDPRG